MESKRAYRLRNFPPTHATTSSSRTDFTLHSS